MTPRRVSNNLNGSQFQIRSGFFWPLISNPPPPTFATPENNTFITRILVVTRCKNMKWILTVGFHIFKTDQPKHIYSVFIQGVWLLE